jgi:hypothetical protein
VPLTILMSGVVVGGGWVVESEFSDRLWFSSSLALAKPNKMYQHSILILREPKTTLLSLRLDS